MKCDGYKQVSCWIPRLPSGRFCATCEGAKARDEMCDIIRSPPPDVLSLTTTPPMLKLLSSSGRDGTLDQLLAAVYRQRRFSDLEALIRAYRATPVENAILLRIRNHRSTSLCAVYGWMLRRGLFPEMFFPSGCLRCLAHAIRSSPAPKADLRRSIFWAQSNLNGPFTTTVRHSMTLPDGLDRLIEFAHALRDSRDESIHSLLQSFHNLCRLVAPAVFYNHFLKRWIAELGPEADKKTCAAQLETFKEELTAKMWHPSRVQYWCWTLDEQKEFDDLPPCPPLHTGKAAWDIHWDI